MKVVVDANIFFAALISSEGMTRDLIFRADLELFSPEFLREEIEKYREVLVKKSGCTAQDVEKAISALLTRIKIISFEGYSNFIESAEKFSPDHNDREYFALALMLNCPFWSNDKALKKQEKVKVLSTSELLKALR